MRAVQRHRLMVFRRACNFLRPKAEELGVVMILADFEAAVARMTEAGEREEFLRRTARSASVRIGELWQELREDLLRPISSAAKRLASTSTEDGRPIGAALRLPRERDLEGIIKASNAIYALALPREAQLVAAGLPPNLLHELARASDALKAAIDARALDYLNRSRARSEFMEAGRDAAAQLRIIDALLRKRGRADSAFRKVWADAKRFGGAKTRAGEHEKERSA